MLVLADLITPHAQRELGEVIGVGVHIYSRRHKKSLFRSHTTTVKWLSLYRDSIEVYYVWISPKLRFNYTRNVLP